MDYSLKHLAKPVSQTKAGEFDPNSKHTDMLRAIAPFAREVTSAKQTSDLSLDYVTKKSKLLLVLLPEWSPFFPPFNLARLSGIAKRAGFQTKIMDVNVRAYNLFRGQKDLNFSLWNSASYWRWLSDESYFADIHPLMEPLFQEVINEIVAYGPELVGFSQYYINEKPTNWMAQELKRRIPGVKIALGGPNIHNGWQSHKPYYDYVVSGEGEEFILQILDEVEQGIAKNPVHIRQPEEQRLVLNDLPLPDYGGIDFNQYQIPNGVNSEFSRGCTAKCTFCEETHFYKYRQRNYKDVSRELEYLYHEKGTDVIWFVDSLVNGSLKELQAFCKEVVARGLKISWTGYSRCDGRMDRAFYEDLAASGCIMLNYGIESGSEKVLRDMNKGVTTAEMEQNLRDGKATGVWASTNWIIGFPTERPQDFAETMTFLWRNRNMNINNIGAGVGYGLGLETIVGQNFEKFNVLDHKYMNHWISRDFRLGGTHVMIRVKCFNIFLDHLLSENKISYPFRENLKKFHYTVKFADPSIQNEIEFDDFDYNIIKPNLNPFADSLVNEVWPMLRLLWKTRGAFSAKILFNPEIDLEEFGPQYGPGIFIAEYDFEILASGQWSADFKFDFTQKSFIYPDDPERNGPFRAQDYSRIKSSGATRARRIAKPEWGENGRTDSDFMKLLNEEKVLNQTLDFSFKLEWKGEGNWQQ
jgi:hypothetical protein